MVDTAEWNLQSQANMQRQNAVGSATVGEIKIIELISVYDPGLKAYLSVGLLNGQWHLFFATGLPKRECDKWHARRLIATSKFVDWIFKPGPNGAQIVTSWKTKGA